MHAHACHSAAEIGPLATRSTRTVLPPLYIRPGLGPMIVRESVHVNSLCGWHQNIH